MGIFSSDTRGRSWMITVHIKNMENVGLDKKEYENPEYLVCCIVDI